MLARNIRQWTFIMPVGVILLINLFIFFSLVRVIANASNPEKSATENAIKQLKAAASITILLGLGWIIAFIGVGPIAPYIQIMFILINGTQGFFMFLFYCVGNEQYIDCWKMKFGMEVTKKGGSTMSSAATAQRATATKPAQAAAPRPAASKPATATPVSAPVAAAAAASPPPPKPSSGAPRTGGATGRANRRGARQKEEPDDIKKEKKLEEAETEDSSAIYENENVYDIIDDPDIKALTAANITRI